MPFSTYVLLEMTHVDLKTKIYCICMWLILFDNFYKRLWYERIYIKVTFS